MIEFYVCAEKNVKTNECMNEYRNIVFFLLLFFFFFLVGLRNVHSRNYSIIASLEKLF